MTHEQQIAELEDQLQAVQAELQSIFDALGRDKAARLFRLLGTQSEILMMLTFLAENAENAQHSRCIYI